MANQKPPLRPNQITLEDLQNASFPLRVRSCNVTGSSFGEYTIPKPLTTKQIEDGRCPAIYHCKYSKQDVHDKVFLADNCIVPYTNGEWNDMNWLEIVTTVPEADIIISNDPDEWGWGKVPCT